MVLKWSKPSTTSVREANFRSRSGRQPCKERRTTLLARSAGKRATGKGMPSVPRTNTSKGDSNGRLMDLSRQATTMAFWPRRSRMDLVEIADHHARHTLPSLEGLATRYHCPTSPARPASHTLSARSLMPIPAPHRCDSPLNTMGYHSFLTAMSSVRVLHLCCQGTPNHIRALPLSFAADHQPPRL